MDAAPELPAAASPSTVQDWKTWGVLGALYVPIIYPILRADRYFQDDLGRSLIGNQYWDGNGRPLTTLLMRILQCHNRALADIAPLPQMAAVAVLTSMGVLIARRFAIRSPWVAALAAFPLGAQPFFLANLSYRFDALSMALAMFFALLPVACPGSGRRGWWLGVLWLLAALSLYQAAINAYLLFVLVEVQWRMARGRPPSWLWGGLAERLTQALVGMLAYQLLIGLPMIDDWVESNSHTIHTLSGLALLPGNISGFYRYIGESFTVRWWMYFSPLLLAMSLLPVAMGMRYAREAYPAWRTWPAAGLLLTVIVMPLIALLCLMGPMLAFVRPFVAARIMMGVGAWLSLGLLVLYWSLEAWRISSRWMLAAGWMLAVGMMAVAGAYGNAQAAQKAYEAAIAARLADDYASVRRETGAKALLLDGTVGHAPVTAHAIGQFPLIGKLTEVYLKGSNPFLSTMYLAYYMPGAAYIEPPWNEADPLASRIRSALTRTCRLEPLRSTAHYEMYVVADVAIGIFHAKSTRRCDQPVDPDIAGLAESAKPLHSPY